MLKNRKTYYFGLIGVLFIVLLALQHYAPKPVNWNLSFKENAKSPYGCFVLKKTLPLILPGAEISENKYSYFEVLGSMEEKQNGLVIITDNFNPDTYDLSSLLGFVKEGGTVFISALGFSKDLEDTLRFSTYSPLIDTAAFRKGKETLNLLNPELRKEDGYIFNRNMATSYFLSFDSLNTKQLGIAQSGDVNYISTKFGEGTFLLHCQPMAFTNFHMLYGDSDYAGNSLAYLSGKTIIWDNYYKPGKLANLSPLRYILSEPALRSAYYLLLVSLIVYMVFEGKRRQRKIPIVKPLENTSLGFIKTVGNLYYNSKNHADLARKKSNYFKEFLRERYYLKTIDLKDETIQQLVFKSGVGFKEIKKLLELIEEYGEKNRVSPDALIKFNNKIEYFYSKCI